MSNESTYENMSQAEIIAEMKSLMKVLEKKEKAQTKLVEKVAEKKEKAAPVKGVRPAQLDKNAKWVEYVHEHILANGWEAFVHAERCGAGMADVEYPASVLVDDAYLFEGTKSEQPNLSHAMTLSKLYKVEKPELYEAFEAAYMPVEAVPVAAKPAVARVSMTLEEKLQQKAQEKEAKEQEKAAKGNHCDDCGEPHKNRKDNFCTLCRLKRKEAEKKQEKEVKAAAAVKPKGAAKAVLPKVVVKVVPKIAKPVLASASASSSSTPSAPLKPAWVAPKKGQTKRVIIGDKEYLVDHLNRAYEPNDPDGCVGTYVPATNTIINQMPKMDDGEEADEEIVME